MQYQLLKQRGALNDTEAVTDSIVAEWSAPAKDSASSIAGSIDLSQWQIPRRILELVPAAICWQYTCIPIALEGDRLSVAAEDADSIALGDRLSILLNQNVRLVPATGEQIYTALQRHEWTVDADVTDSLCEMADVDDECDEEAAPQRRLKSRGIAPETRVPRRRSGTVELRETLSHFGGAQCPSHVSRSRSGMFYYTIPEGSRVLITRLDGTREILVGPSRVWKGRSEFHEMSQHTAHPGDYLIVRYRDGHQEHVIGPAEVWHDPRIHERIDRVEGLQIASKEAIVVYTHSKESGSSTTRRIVYGPDLFVPQPGEWLHTFSWHASSGGSRGVEKVPNGLVFQKLWLMPDQMYHDVHDVRTSDDAVLTLRLMIFFELVDIDRMLESTHDPIGDFVNAATADVVEFTGRYAFEAFKQNTGKLNDLATYSQLSSRAKQIGYQIHNVVYRGYGAAASLQQMHNQAIEARTKLQLDRATEQQAQELENFRLESQLSRSAKRRSEQGDEVRHDLDLDLLKSRSELQIRDAQQVFAREQRLADARTRDEADRMSAAQQQAHLAVLRDMGVDLTTFLTQNRADQVFEFRGPATPQVHIDPVQLEKSHSAPKPSGQSGP